MPIPLAGYNTGGEIDGVPIALTEWEVNPEVDDLDGTSTESGGFHVAFPGPVKCEITITGFFDATNNPYGVGTNGLEAGQYVGLTIFVNDNADVGASPFWDFPFNEETLQGAMVKSCQTKASVKEKVMFTAHLIGSGEFIYPEGDVI
jgi:hypothetical protein